MSVLQRVLLSLVLLAVCCSAHAQDDPYRAEIGLQTGLTLYSGDANTIAARGLFAENLKNLAPDFGVIFRYRFSQRIALGLEYDFTRVKGRYTYMDAGQTFVAALNNLVHAFDVYGEFNFFDLSNNPHKRFSKRFSPFIFGGIGGIATPAYRSAEAGDYLTATIPFGAGVKLKINERWNLCARLTNRWIMGDNLEGVPAFDNPAPKTRANGMNNDLLSGFNISITYDFWARDCNCLQPATSSGGKPKPHKTVKPKTNRKKGK